MSELKTYIVWNPYKLENHTNLDTNTFAGLKDSEKNADASISSVIKTDDIDAISQAIVNETDIELVYYCVEEHVISDEMLERSRAEGWYIIPSTTDNSYTLDVNPTYFDKIESAFNFIASQALNGSKAHADTLALFVYNNFNYLKQNIDANIIQNTKRTTSSIENEAMSKFTTFLDSQV